MVLLDILWFIVILNRREMCLALTAWIQVNAAKRLSHGLTCLLMRCIMRNATLTCKLSHEARQTHHVQTMRSKEIKNQRAFDIHPCLIRMIADLAEHPFAIRIAIAKKGRSAYPPKTRLDCTEPHAPLPLYPAVVYRSFTFHVPRYPDFNLLLHKSLMRSRVSGYGRPCLLSRSQDHGSPPSRPQTWPCSPSGWRTREYVQSRYRL